jgi:hypothetical protein
MLRTVAVSFIMGGVLTASHAADHSASQPDATLALLEAADALPICPHSVSERRARIRHCKPMFNREMMSHTSSANRAEVSGPSARTHAMHSPLPDGALLRPQSLDQTR